MSGAIMPEPLAMPEITTGTPSNSTVAVATLAKVSVVMIALAASIHGPARQAVGHLGGDAGELLRIERFADHPGGGEEDLVGCATPSALRDDIGRQRPHEALLFWPVKALALPELTSSARALPPPRFCRHQSTAAEGHLERVSTPATTVPSSIETSRTSVAILVFDPGLGRCEPNSRDIRQFRVSPGGAGETGWAMLRPMRRQ